jgi:hypothetical protein
MHHRAAAALIAVVMAVAAVTRDEPHEEATEEDGTDDEDAACHDAHPCGDGVQSTGAAIDDDWLGRRRNGRRMCGNRVDWPGLWFGRCFAQASMIRAAPKRW